MESNTTTEKYFLSAISKMRSPKDMHIICIDITNKCDLACSNCTRLLENQEKFWDMSVANFRNAVRSLKNYPGMIAVIGGNPSMHKNFEEICNVLEDEIPDKSKRGLWTNNIFKHTDIAKRVFGGFNLNPHGDERGIKSLEQLKNLNIGNYYEGNSLHSPLLTAVKDFYPEKEMWKKISSCDINREWSASIVENKGNLRAYFCEVAAAFDLARGTDHGIPVTEDWWNNDIKFFANQVKMFCPGCGVPARFKPTIDSDESDTYSVSNSDLAQKSSSLKKRKIIEIKVIDQDFDLKKVTDYSESHRLSTIRFKKILSKISLKLKILFR